MIKVNNYKRLFENGFYTKRKVMVIPRLQPSKWRRNIEKEVFEYPKPYPLIR